MMSDFERGSRNAFRARPQPLRLHTHLHVLLISLKFHTKIPNSFANIAPAMSEMCVHFNYENIIKEKHLHQHAHSPKNFSIY